MATIIAEDLETLEVFSARLQDTILRVGDMAYLPKTQRFAFVGSRFCWEEVDTAKRKPFKGRKFHRVQSGFHFDNVIGVKSSGIDQSDPDGLLSLLSIVHENGDNESLTLTFAGGGTLLLAIDGLEGSLSDLSEKWVTDKIPDHNLGG